MIQNYVKIRTMCAQKNIYTRLGPRNKQGDAPPPRTGFHPNKNLDMIKLDRNPMAKRQESRSVSGVISKHLSARGRGITSSF